MCSLSHTHRLAEKGDVESIDRLSTQTEVPECGSRSELGGPDWVDGVFLNRVKEQNLFLRTISMAAHRVLVIIGVVPSLEILRA